MEQSAPMTVHSIVLKKNLRGNFLCSDAVMDDDYNLIDTNENRYLSI